MLIRKYTSELKQEWDGFVAGARQQTFLVKRDFMDYHADRFVDCSVMVYAGGLEDLSSGRLGKLICVLPANWDEKDGIVYSHQGLTYGGLITSEGATQTEVLEAFELICVYYREQLGAQHLVYKTIPYIYSSMPAEEDRYVMFRLNAELQKRLVSTVVELQYPVKMRTLRRRGVKKAQMADLRIECVEDVQSADIEVFWQILNTVLVNDHQVRPVHSVAEMRLLMERLPREIRLFVVRNPAGEVIAGSWVFEMTHVAHTQYISANEEGKKCGALDLLFNYLIKERYAHKRYIDFGNSNEEGGRVLNEGLIFQKEGFGGRAVCYDQYMVDL